MTMWVKGNQTANYSLMSEMLNYDDMPVKNDAKNGSWIDAMGNVSTTTKVSKWASLASPISMCIFGIAGNIMALIVIARTKKERKMTIFYRLVAQLAVVDLLGQIATTPVVIVTYVNDFHWPGGQALCEYFSFVMVFFGVTTLQTVCAMAIERYIALRHPYASQKYLTYDKAKYVVFVIVGTSFILAILPNIGFGTNVRQFPGTWCFFRFINIETYLERIYGYVFCGVGLSIVTMTLFCNISVAFTMIQMCRKRRSRSMSIQSQLDEVYSTKTLKSRRAGSCDRYELQMLILLAGITCIFSICWAPLMVRILITLIRPHSNDSVSVLIVIRLASLNQILDPWIYILFRREVFKRLKNFFKTIFARMSGQKPSLRTNAIASNAVLRNRFKSSIHHCSKKTKSRISVKNSLSKSAHCDSEQQNMLDNSESVTSTPEKSNGSFKDGAKQFSSSTQDVDLTDDNLFSASFSLVLCVPQNTAASGITKQSSFSYFSPRNKFADVMTRKSCHL